MRYQLALEILERIEEVLRLIKTGEFSTPALAQAAAYPSVPFPEFLLHCEKGGALSVQNVTKVCLVTFLRRPKNEIVRMFGRCLREGRRTEKLLDPFRAGRRSRKKKEFCSVETVIKT